MKVSVGISNRHVHFQEDDYQILFQNTKLEKEKDLKQPGQFASNLKVDIQGPKGVIKDVRVVGPFRNYTQVEVSKTDARKLGIDPPVRTSGDLRDASSITIIGPFGQIEKSCAILSTRHIHVDHDIRISKGLLGVQEVAIKIPGSKSGILEHVELKDSDKAYFEVHLDTDEGNAFLLKNDDEVEIIL